MVTGLLACLAMLAAPPAPAPVIIDGEFADWSTIAPLSDPSGDAIGPFDVSFFQARSDGTRVVVSFDAGRVLNLQNGPESDVPLCMDVRLPDGRWLSVDLRNRRAELPGRERRVRWSEIGLMSAPTFAADRFEVALDLASLGVRVGEQVQVALCGSDTLDSGPLTLTLAAASPAAAAAPTPLTRHPGADLRIANLNTHRDGLHDPDSIEPLGRLIAAADADVYTFQEEWETPADAIATRLAAITPGDAWNVHKVDGCIIATRRELAPEPNHNNRYAAAIIDPTSSRPLLVLSIHPKCCGFIGSSEDHDRIEQTRAMIRTITDARRRYRRHAPGGYDLPVIVIGDWNLVGSDTPLRMLTDPDGPALMRWTLRHPDGRDVYTYRDDRSSFPPGVLDLLTHSPSGLTPLRGMVLDTADLTVSQLRDTGLQAGDCRASDHLMLIADFRLGTPE